MSVSSAVRRSRGFTLVELMVALLLSLLVVGLTLNIFLISRESYRAQVGLSMVKENGRTAMDLLSREISMAGYPRSRGIAPIVMSETFDGASDEITVLYQSDTDCIGNAAPVYADGFSYAKNKYFVSNKSLMCSSLAEDDSVIDTQEFVYGIDNMQILYGIDGIKADGIPSPTRYVNFSEVGDVGEVMAVRIGVLASSQDEMSSSADEETYVVLDGNAAGPFNDMRRRSVFISTMLMRNTLE